MKVEVTATNVQEFSPVTLNLSVKVEDVSELASLSVDADMFATDGLKISDSNGRPYSDELSTIVTSLFTNLIKSKQEEGEKKQS